MLRLLQWAYRLGVRHERERIAQYLMAVNPETLDSPFDSRYRQEVHESTIEYDDRLKKLQVIDSEVKSRICTLLANMFHREGEYVSSGSSIMFPEEGEN